MPKLPYNTLTDGRPFNPEDLIPIHITTGDSILSVVGSDRRVLGTDQ